ncbi:MAG: hypothetical protein SGI71_01530 [Verrucomicrobiota bacterium]|nr:hypothetical protein [Verrucomicrobiota bacterium]
MKLFLILCVCFFILLILGVIGSAVVISSGWMYKKAVADLNDGKHQISFKKLNGMPWSIKAHEVIYAGDKGDIVKKVNAKSVGIGLDWSVFLKNRKVALKSLNLADGVIELDLSQEGNGSLRLGLDKVTFDQVEFKMPQLSGWATELKNVEGSAHRTAGGINFNLTCASGKSGVIAFEKVKMGGELSSTTLTLRNYEAAFYGGTLIAPGTLDLASQSLNLPKVTVQNADASKLLSGIGYNAHRKGTSNLVIESLTGDFAGTTKAISGKGELNLINGSTKTTLPAAAMLLGDDFRGKLENLNGLKGNILFVLQGNKIIIAQGSLINSDLKIQLTPGGELDYDKTLSMAGELVVFPKTAESLPSMVKMVLKEDPEGYRLPFTVGNTTDDPKIDVEINKVINNPLQNLFK